MIWSIWSYIIEVRCISMYPLFYSNKLVCASSYVHSGNDHFNGMSHLKMVTFSLELDVVTFGSYWCQHCLEMPTFTSFVSTLTWWLYTKMQIVPFLWHWRFHKMYCIPCLSWIESYPCLVFFYGFLKNIYFFVFNLKCNCHYSTNNLKYITLTILMSSHFH